MLSETIYSDFSLSNRLWTTLNNIKTGKEDSFHRFHPWYSQDDISLEKQPEEGDIVEVTDHQGNFIGIGQYQIGSIAVRILTFKQEEINEQFYFKRLQEAYNVRLSLGLLNGEYNNTCRLVHGEGDNLPGLIIDLYNKTAVMQAHTPGMHYARHQIAQALKSVLGNAIDNIYYKSETTLPYKAELDAENEYLLGGDAPNIATENGLKFYVDWVRGQKTGFFVDQRENRALLERYAHGRSVLNMFCYTGGFSLRHAGNAKLVHSVDVTLLESYRSGPANVELNFPEIIGIKHLPKMRSNFWILWEINMI